MPRNYLRELARWAEHEISFSGLFEKKLGQLYVLDGDPSDATHFDVKRHNVAINNEKLTDALSALPDDKRDIVLLAYFLA